MRVQEIGLSSVDFSGCVLDKCRAVVPTEITKMMKISGIFLELLALLMG